MLHPTLVILLPLVVLFSLVFEITEANSNVANKLHSPEAEEVIIKLQKQYDDLQESFDDHTNKLEANNDLLDAVKAYRKASESATDTDCADKDPPNDDKDNDVIKSFIRGCKGSLLKEDLDKFTGKIAASKAKVKEIDDSLHATCTSDVSACDEAKKQATEKLNGILTPQLNEQLKNDASALVEKYKTSLDECFNGETAELVKNLVQGTEAMNTCLATKS